MFEYEIPENRSSLMDILGENRKEISNAAQRLLTEFKAANPQIASHRIFPRFEIKEQDGATILNVTIEVR